MPSKYDPEKRARAVRLVREHRDGYPSEWAAITAVFKRLGMTAETLRSWIRHSRSMTVIVMGCPASGRSRYLLARVAKAGASLITATNIAVAERRR